MIYILVNIYIYVYYILRIIDWKYKKWDLILYFGIVEMKVIKKIEIYVYMYVFYNKIFKIKSLVKKK